MAFSGNFMCTSFKKELMEGVHNFKSSGGSTFNLAMYTNSASFNAATTAYTSGNEVSGTNYTAKGVALTRIDPASSGTTAFTQFSNAVFSNVTLTAVRGALVFNDTASGDPTVCVLDFGGDKAASAGDFTVVMPTNNSSNALIRIA
jgi:PKD repeat protein